MDRNVTCYACNNYCKKWFHCEMYVCSTWRMRLWRDCDTCSALSRPKRTRGCLSPVLRSFFRSRPCISPPSGVRPAIPAVRRQPGSSRRAAGCPSTNPPSRSRRVDPTASIPKKKMFPIQLCKSNCANISLTESMFKLDIVHEISVFLFT